MTSTLGFRRRAGLVVATLVAVAVPLSATPAGAHRQDHGGQFPHTPGTNVYLPYMHMTANGYVAETNFAMRAWYDTPTRLWPYQTTDNRASKIDVYTGWYNATWWGLVINRPCNYLPHAGCRYSWADMYLNTQTMGRETLFTRQAIAVHEVGHTVGLSHSCKEYGYVCPAGYYPTIMQWGRLPYNRPQAHDVADVNAIYR